MLKSILQTILRILAKKIIGKYHPDIIGITGSIGKTSTKEAVTAVLSTKFRVRSNVKNYNNEIGLPLSVVGAEKTPGHSILGWFGVFARALGLIVLKNKNYPEKLVLEMGADKPGDIRYLTLVAPCRVGVLTYISHAHTEFFKTLAGIAQEKRIIITHLKKDGFAVLNFDNDLVRQQAPKTDATVVTYGFKEGAELRATDVNIILDESTGWPSGLNFKISYKGSIVPAFIPGQVAEHLIPSALAGIAVGAVFGINLVDGVEAVKQIPPLPGHMRLLPGIKNTLIIDDTYNSSPEPTRSAIATLAKIKIKDGARRFAVLGDMLELGAETENAHREIGLRTAEYGLDFLITVGEASKHTAQAAKEAGLGDNQVAMFADSVSAARFLQDKIKKGDAILIKGSQGARMEKIVKEIMAEPEKAEELLVRQTKEWV